MHFYFPMFSYNCIWSTKREGVTRDAGGSNYWGASHPKMGDFREKFFPDIGGGQNPILPPLTRHWGAFAPPLVCDEFIIPIHYALDIFQSVGEGVDCRISIRDMKGVEFILCFISPTSLFYCILIYKWSENAVLFPSSFAKISKKLKSVSPKYIRTGGIPPISISYI